MRESFGGERCPFASPFASAVSDLRLRGFVGREGADAADSIVVRGATCSLRLSSRRLLPRGRERLSGSEPELPASSLTEGGEVIREARDRDLVMGPKYPSLDPLSEGVGDGEVTLGVLGMG